MNNQKIATEHVNTAVAHLLKIEDGRFSIDLTRQDAEKIGISSADFERIMEELKETNEFISQAEKEKDHEIILIDPKTVKKETLQQTLPSGTLTSNGQEQVGTGFFAPIYTAKVRFTCRGHAALTPAFTCRTRALGDWKSKTVIGSSLFTTDVDVNLDASNYNVSITFQTTDSNGGTANWQAMY